MRHSSDQGNGSEGDWAGLPAVETAWTRNGEEQRAPTSVSHFTYDAEVRPGAWPPT